MLPSSLCCSRGGGTESAPTLSMAGSKALPPPPLRHLPMALPLHLLPLPPAQVRLARRYERRWAPTAHAHLCVSRAMAVDLSRAWRVSAAVFHDRPTPALRPAKIEETHALLQRLRPDLARPQHPGDWLAAELAGTASSATPLTVRTAPGQAPARRGGRPALVLSSTSWTADEDFGLLLRAAELYDARVRVQGVSFWFVWGRRGEEGSLRQWGLARREGGWLNRMQGRGLNRNPRATRGAGSRHGEREGAHAHETLTKSPMRMRHRPRGPATDARFATLLQHSCMLCAQACP